MRATASIYAQSEGEGMGTLTVSNDSGNAAIGGGLEENSGLITIHGGEIEAKTLHLGAAIGGGGGGVYGCDGTVTIYGGSVLAITNKDFGAAIGGGGGSGGNGGDGTVTIRGGTVEARATLGISFDAAIGGGKRGSGSVEISGGTITAETSGYGAGIGGGVEIGGRHARPRGGERKRSCSGPEG